VKAIVTEIMRETPEISSFRLAPEADVKYVAGQWMYVRLTPELKHHFTISASPTEPYLQFTTKNRSESEYKKHLWSMKTGDGVEITGPFGSFVLDEADTGPKIFVAGGIGITPFRSMIKYTSDKKLDLNISLLYSVKNKSEGAFVDELMNVKYQMSNN